MNKTLLIVLVLAVVVVGIWMLSSSSQAPQQQASVQQPANDTVAAINSDLNSINVNDLDQDFQSVNSDLNTL